MADALDVVLENINLTPLKKKKDLAVYQGDPIDPELLGTFSGEQNDSFPGSLRITRYQIGMPNADGTNAYLNIEYILQGVFIKGYCANFINHSIYNLQLLDYDPQIKRTLWLRTCNYTSSENFPQQGCPGVIHVNPGPPGQCPGDQFGTDIIFMKIGDLYKLSGVVVARTAL